MTTVTTGKSVQYELTVVHTRAKLRWELHRTFDDFHAFQRRLLTALHHGHACAAGGCPWLENFLVSYFPAQRLLLPVFFLHESSPSLVKRRVEGLLKALRTVQRFLVAHKNHACAVVATGVAPEFLRFLCGDSKFSGVAEALRLDAITALTDSRQHRSSLLLPKSDVGSGRFRSPTESTSDSSSGADSAAEICALCDGAMPAADVYVTRLRCGHRFHDECVLPKLNEALLCPICGERDDDQ